jgi:hypothetical protein
MANRPFNVDEVDAEKVKGDKRLPFGLPGVNKGKKVSNANYLWLTYFYSYLNDNGRAGVVMSSQASKLLLQENHRYVFSLIHKFNQDVKAEEPYSERDDIIVISDEAHRTQAGRLARNMRVALPNAAFCQRSRKTASFWTGVDRGPGGTLGGVAVDTCQGHGRGAGSRGAGLWRRA